MDKLRTLTDRWPLVRRALEVHQRVAEIDGRFIAAAVTVSIFTSVFPMILVALSVIGFMAAGDPTLTDRIVDNLALTGSAAEMVETAVDNASSSRQASSVIGILGLAWTASMVGVALQQAVRRPWQARSFGMKDRLMGMAWLAVAGLGFAAAVALGGVLNFLPDEVPAPLATVAAILVGLTLEIGLFWWMFWGLGTRRAPARDLLPGAIAAGIGFEILKLVGTIYVPRLVASSSSLYGPIGIVFAILAWLMVFARLLLYCSALNAVRYEAEAGTIQVPIHAPKFPDFDPVAATRGGVLLSAEDVPPSIPAQSDDDDKGSGAGDGDAPRPSAAVPGVVTSDR